jgi:hypothetical protein
MDRKTKEKKRSDPIFNPNPKQGAAGTYLDPPPTTAVLQGRKRHRFLGARTTIVWKRTPEPPVFAGVPPPPGGTATRATRVAARRGASQRRAAARRLDAGGALVGAPKGTTEVPLDRTRRPRLLRCAAQRKRRKAWVTDRSRRRTEQHMRAVRPGHGCSVPRWPVRTARRDERRRRRQHERERREELKARVTGRAGRRPF